jgi:hypothetical protein
LALRPRIIASLLQRPDLKLYPLARHLFKVGGKREWTPLALLQQTDEGKMFAEQAPELSAELALRSRSTSYAKNAAPAVRACLQRGTGMCSKHTKCGCIVRRGENSQLLPSVLVDLVVAYAGMPLVPDVVALKGKSEAKPAASVRTPAAAVRPADASSELDPKPKSGSKRKRPAEGDDVKVRATGLRRRK